jgi:hypothetical protein
MKLPIQICFALVTLGGCALAQQSAIAPSVNDNRADNAYNPVGLRTVEGCLSKTDGTYVITGGAPGPKQFRIISGDVSSLKGKIGHTVKVVGVVAKNDALANQNELYNEGSTTGAEYLTIDAQKISEVFGNCSEAGKEWAGEHK